jgi:zinc transporter 1/2/3
MDADGNDVLIEEEATAESTDEHSENDQEESSSGTEQNCHFHAGVEYDSLYLEISCGQLLIL